MGVEMSGSHDYWRDCVAEALEDAGLAATDAQIDTVAGWVEGAYDNYSTAFGHDVASANRAADQRKELADARAEIKREREKVTCRQCNGTGRIITFGPIHSSDFECLKCRGEGRHDP